MKWRTLSERPKVAYSGAKVQEKEKFLIFSEGLICLLARSVDLVGRQIGQFLWSSVRKCPNRQRTKCREHACQKIRPAEDLKNLLSPETRTIADKVK